MTSFLLSTFVTCHARTSIPGLVLSSIHFPEELPRSVSLTAIQQRGVRTDAFRAETRGPQHSAKTLALRAEVLYSNMVPLSSSIPLLVSHYL